MRAFSVVVLVVGGGLFAGSGGGLAAGLSVAGLAPAQAVMAGQVMPTAPAGVAATTGKLGARPGASRLPIPVSDAVDASVDVGTGNVMITVAGLPIPGVGVVGLVNNSQSTERSTTSGLPQRFELSAGSAGSLSTVTGGVLYEGGDGFSAKFTSVSGSATAFTAAKGVKADLVKTATGYTLTSRTTAQVSTFNADGQILSVADRNGNKTTFAYTGGVISKVTGFFRAYRGQNGHCYH